MKKEENWANLLRQNSLNRPSAEPGRSSEQGKTRPHLTLTHARPRRVPRLPTPTRAPRPPLSLALFSRSFPAPRPINSRRGHAHARTDIPGTTWSISMQTMPVMMTRMASASATATRRPQGTRAPGGRAPNRVAFPPARHGGCSRDLRAAGLGRFFGVGDHNNKNHEVHR